MNSPLTDNDIDDTIRTNCFRDHIMMACKEDLSNNLEVLAWAHRDQVFKVTDEVGCGKDGDVDWRAYVPEGPGGLGSQECKTLKNGGTSNWDATLWDDCSSDWVNDTDWFTHMMTCYAIDCQRDQCSLCSCGCDACSCNDSRCTGSIDNGVKWYRVAGGNGTWGFAFQDSTINLHWVDVAYDESNSKRLSMHVNANDVGWNGGHRCGQTRASYNQESGLNVGEWKLVFYHTDVPV